MRQGVLKIMEDAESEAAKKASSVKFAFNSCTPARLDRKNPPFVRESWMRLGGLT